MIVRDTLNLLTLLFEVRGSVIRTIYRRVLFVMALSAVVVWAHAQQPKLIPVIDGVPFSLIGLALSIFLGFRNNACYDRWWEGRKLWGLLLALSRDLARQTNLLLHRGADATAARSRLLRLNIVLADELVRYLRSGDQLTQSAAATLSKDEQAVLLATHNPPSYVLQLMGCTLADLVAQGHLSDTDYLLLDRTLAEMNGALAGCERLRNTPVPFGYTLLLHRTAYLFCFLLPFGFADLLGVGTPFAVGVIAYTFFGLDALGDELEVPFGTLPNALPIAAIAKTIEITLRESLGEQNLPKIPEPVNSILL